MLNPTFIKRAVLPHFDPIITFLRRRAEFGDWLTKQVNLNSGAMPAILGLIIIFPVDPKSPKAFECCSKSCVSCG